MHGRLVRVTPPVIGADVGNLRAQSQAGRRLPCREWPGVAGPGGIGLVGVCCRAASLQGSSVAIRTLAGGVGGDKCGRLTGDRVADGTLGTAVRRAGQVLRPRSAGGRAGRAIRTRISAAPEPRGSDEPGQRRTSSGRWARPACSPRPVDALPGEHGPDIAERREPDLTGLAERDVENSRGRAARILDRHEILGVGGDAAGPAAPRDPIRSPRNICVPGGQARSGPVIAPGTGDLGPGRTGPTPAEPPGGNLLRA